MSPPILNQQPWPQSEHLSDDEFDADMAYLRSLARAIFEYAPATLLRDIAERDAK